MAVEIARVLNIKNKGSLGQGYFGELYPHRRSKASKQSTETRSPASSGMLNQITVVTWSLGHMLQIEADEPNPTTTSPSSSSKKAASSWKLENLPRVPNNFKLVPLPSASTYQLEVLRVLMTKATGTELIVFVLAFCLTLTLNYPSNCLCY